MIKLYQLYLSLPPFFLQGKVLGCLNFKRRMPVSVVMFLFIYVLVGEFELFQTHQ